MKSLALALLLPALALAAPPAPRRAVSLVVPMDPDSESVAVQVEGYMNESLEEFAGLAVRKPEALFGMPEDSAAQASLERAKKGYSEAVAAFDKKDYESAEHKVRATLKELQGAAGAMHGCSPLCESLALYSAVLQLRGDVEEAKLALMDLMALSPTFELNPKRYSRDLIALRVQVATGRNALLRGSALLKSRPGGARVFVDNEPVGFAPVTLPALTVGKHLVRMERPGFRQYGTIMEVTTEDIEVSANLTPTAAYQAYDAQLDKVAGEVVRAGPNAMSVSLLGKSLSVDRVMMGTVKSLGESGTELHLGYYDVRNGKRLGGRRVVLQGDEFGQLRQEMERMVNQLVNNADGGGEKVVKSSDPLDNRSGSEDWNSEDRGGRQRAADKKKKSGDPLDGMSGTEDW